MSSIKLTVGIKDEIIKNVISYKFKKKVEKLRDHIMEFAEDVYVDSFTEGEWNLMLSLPKGWLGQGHSVGAKFGEGSEGCCRIPFNGNMELYYYNAPFKIQFEEKSKVFPHEKLNAIAKIYDSKHPLSHRYFTLKSMRDELQEEIRKATKQVQVALDKVTTVGALKKSWEEITPFLPQYVTSGQNTSLMIPVEDLNKLLDLPVKRKVGL